MHTVDGVTAGLGCLIFLAAVALTVYAIKRVVWR
jgi:hypothetical protein